MGTDLSPKIHDRSPFLDLRPPGFYPLAGKDILHCPLAVIFYNLVRLQTGCREVKKGELRIIKELTESAGVKNKRVTYFG
jgi:hypothetical protein